MKSETIILKQDSLVSDELTIEMSGGITGIAIHQGSPFEKAARDTVFVQYQHIDAFIEKMQQLKQAIDNLY